MASISEAPVQPPPAPTHHRRWPKRLGIAVLALALFGIGAGIGAAANDNGAALTRSEHTVASQRNQISSQQSRISSLQSQVTTLQDQVSAAQQRAAKAVSDANAKAKADYAARNAALKQRENNLKRQQRALDKMLGQVQANQISDSGVYVVGQDIKSGVWHTPGDNGVGGDACYYAALRDNNDSLDSIINNNNFDGPETVDVSGAYALEISGPCTWYLTG